MFVAVGKIVRGASLHERCHAKRARDFLEGEIQTAKSKEHVEALLKATFREARQGLPIGWMDGRVFRVLSITRNSGARFL